MQSLKTLQYGMRFSFASPYSYTVVGAYIHVGLVCIRYSYQYRNLDSVPATVFSMFAQVGGA